MRSDRLFGHMQSGICFAQQIIETSAVFWGRTRCRCWLKGSIDDPDRRKGCWKGWSDAGQLKIIGNNFLDVIDGNFPFYIFDEFLDDTFRQFYCYFFLLNEDCAIKEIMAPSSSLRSIWCFGPRIRWCLREFRLRHDTKMFFKIEIRVS